MSLLEGLDFAQLRLFLTIVRRRSFKVAAIEHGLTPSAASHAVRRLEARLGSKLLNRTSRAVSPTDVGAQLARDLEDGFDRIGAALMTLNAPGIQGLGELRLNVFADASNVLLGPALPEFARQCPDVRLTIAVDDSPIDIVQEGYDAGIRYGHHVPADMIAVALSGPLRWIVAGSPAYLADRGEPKTLDDLAAHTCIQLQLGDNSAYRWELGRGDSERPVKVPGLLTINDTATTIAAAKAGLGLAYVLEQRVRQELADGSLKMVLEDFAADGAPFHAYYGSRRHNHPALRTLINIIRQQNGLPKISSPSMT